MLYEYIVDKQLEEKLDQKINEVADKSDEIFKIVKSLDELKTSSDSFVYGIVIGRLYNSFYYQCRRILKRNPTSEEFEEFLKILNKRQKEILDLLK
jgi:preprotein translocase subunit Sss1